MKKEFKFGTIAVQGDYKPGETGARVLPIYQTASYQLNDADHAANLFDLKEEGNIYSRIMNPTNGGFENKIALLEGGVGALATASGQAAITLAILNICKVGDHIIAASTLYGGTYNLFKNTMSKVGIEVSFIHPDEPIDNILSLAKTNTKLIYGETIGNPGMNVLDFEKFSKVAKAIDVPLIIDNTFASPYLCRPLEHGANIVIHSATKYIGGHGNSIGGIIVDGGNYNWNNEKFQELVDPDPSYHGIRYHETFGQAAYIVKARVQLLRDYGACLSPFNAFLFNTGLETLHLRMRAHSDNAKALAEHLSNHPKVSWVSYASLTQSEYKPLHDKYLPNGAGGMFTFGVKGGSEAGKQFINSVELATIVANVGDARTMVIHPASTTHRQLDVKQQLTSGVTPDLVRVSVGIEDIEDIIKDFDQALECL